VSEGDYMIVTSQQPNTPAQGGKKKIILEQLKDLGLEKHYEIFIVPIDKDKERVLISICVPEEKIDEFAESIGIGCGLSMIEQNIKIDAQFK